MIYAVKCVVVLKRTNTEDQAKLPRFLSKEFVCFEVGRIFDAGFKHQTHLLQTWFACNVFFSVMHSCYFWHHSDPYYSFQRVLSPPVCDVS